MTGVVGDQSERSVIIALCFSLLFHRLVIQRFLRWSRVRRSIQISMGWAHHSGGAMSWVFLSV